MWKVIVFKQNKVDCIYFKKCIMLNSNGNENGKKIIGLISKTKNFASEAQISMPLVLHNYNW